MVHIFDKIFAGVIGMCFISLRPAKPVPRKSSERSICLYCYHKVDSDIIGASYQAFVSFVLISCIFISPQ